MTPALPPHATTRIPGLPPLFYDSVDHSRPWLTANGLAARCRWAWNYAGLVENDVGNNWAFCKTDFIADFLTLGLPFSALFTHNSDHAVQEVHRADRHWFAVNAVVDHPRVHGLPLSLANAGWQHGDVGVLARVLGSPIDKDRLFYSNFSVWTNPPERTKCLRAVAGVKQEVGMLPFEDHLRAMRRSHFCISPSGSGIDCHRTWEALIVGTIPIVTRSITARDHADWPIVVLGDWGDFRAEDFTPGRYADLWGDFRPEALHMESYLRRLRDRYGLR